MQSILLFIHSWLRWLIVLAGAAAAIRLLIGLIAGGEYDRLARGLTATFTGLLDLQVLLGVLLLIVGWRGYSAAAGGGFPVTQFEHLGAMVVAAGVSHFSNRWADSPHRRRFLYNLIVVLIALVLIFLGVSVLTGARWVFRGV